MKKLLLILDHRDLVFSDLFRGKDFELDLISFSPEIVDYAKKNHNIDVKFFNLFELSTLSVAQESARIHAHEYSVLLDKSIDVQGCENWLYDEFYQFIFSSILYKAAAAIFVESFNLDVSKIIVLINDGAFDYGRTSYLAGAIFGNALLSKFPDQVEFFSIPVESPDSLRYVAADVCPNAFGADVWVHMPTMFYDFNKFEKHIVENFKNPLYLRSLKYNPDNINLRSIDVVDVCGEAAELASDESSLKKNAGKIDAIFREMFPKFSVPEIFWDRQKAIFLMILEYRLELYEKLIELPDDVLPKCLCIANHEAGFTSVLMNFAHTKKIPSIIFPHSKIHNFPLMIPRNMVHKVVAHQIQGSGIKSVNGQLINSDLIDFEDYPSEGFYRRGTDAVKKIGIVATGVSHFGVCITDFKRLVDFIKDMTELLGEHAIKLSIRFKPNEFWGFSMLTSASGDFDNIQIDDSDSLDEFVQKCDYCFSIDGLTSGLISALNAGVPCAHIVIKDLPRDEMLMNDLNLIPFVAASDFSEFLKKNVLSSKGKNEFAMSQRLNYFSRRQKSGELIDFLEM